MEELINIELKILMLFKRLCKLEIEGKKNSSKYQSILVDLRNKIKDEENLLTMPGISNITEDDYNKILEKANKIDKDVGTRIMTRLTGILVKNMCEEAQEKEIAISDKIGEEIQTNIILFYVKFLYEFIEKEQDKFLKTHLLLEFYNSCYIEPRVNDLLIKDSFIVRDDYFKSCYFIADFLGVNRNDAQVLIDESCCELLTINVIEDLFSKNHFINSVNRRYDLVSNLCMVKAIRTIMSEETFNRYQSALIESVNENKLLTHPNYNLVMHLLSDETKPQETKIITFGKPLRKIKEKNEEQNSN